MISVCFVTDESYVLTTLVAICSLAENKRQDTEVAVHVLGTDLSTAAQQAFQRLARDRMTVSVLNIENPYASIETRHVWISKAAMLKFELSTRFPELDKILYLDGDMAVLEDLTDLFNTDISHVYAGVVLDERATTNGGHHTKLGLASYFNSGMMLLNLAKMREDNIKETLIRNKVEDSFQHFMDQDAFNKTFNEQVLQLSPRFNVMKANFFCQDPKQLCAFYQIQPQELADICAHPVILHFTNALKPWITNETLDYAIWRLYFDKLPTSEFTEKYLSERFCPLCGNRSAFRDRPPRRNAVCPHCGSLERHRFLFFNYQKYFLQTNRRQKVLQIAPEISIYKLIIENPYFSYIGADLHPELYNFCDCRKEDATALSFADKTFDVVLANHVLEHLDDERAFLWEIYRVLKTGGIAILSFPRAINCAETFSDASATSEEERTRLFGQKDHVRRYGMDAGSRLQALIPFLSVTELSRSVFSEAHLQGSALRVEYFSPESLPFQYDDAFFLLQKKSGRAKSSSRPKLTYGGKVGKHVARLVDWLLSFRVVFVLARTLWRLAKQVRGCPKINKLPQQAPSYAELVKKQGRFRCIDRIRLDKPLAAFTASGLCEKKRSPRLIISMTSIPRRMDTIHYALFSLLNQTVKPDLLVLWLGESFFPNREKDLPASVLRLRQNGLTIRWCQDICCFTKLVPSLRAYPDDIIVTADDDIYYPPDWLEELYRAYAAEPTLVHCHRAHRIVPTPTGVSSYATWKKSIAKVAPSYLNFLTGVGGVLYPPHSLHRDATAEARFMALTPSNDDVWFWAMAVLNHARISVTPGTDKALTYINPDNELGRNGTRTLALQNVHQNKNDDYLAAVLAAYPELGAMLREDEKRQ